MLLDPRSDAAETSYHLGKENFCPTCGQNHWWIGRTSAECGICATALPLLERGFQGSGTRIINQRPVSDYDWAIE